MSVKLRFARAGRKKQAFYHVVVADERAPRNGRYLERVGYYNPNIKENRLNWDADRVAHWLNTGAQPTTAVAKLILAEKVGTDKVRARIEAKLQERFDAVSARIAKAKAAKEAEEKAAADAAAAEAAAAAAEAEAAAAPVEEAPAEEAPVEAAAEETKDA